MQEIKIDGWLFSSDRLMTTRQVADVFRVEPHTVALWARTGKLASIRTPGGHRRFSRDQVEAILRGENGAAR